MRAIARCGIELIKVALYRSIYMTVCLRRRSCEGRAIGLTLTDEYSIEPIIRILILRDRHPT